MKATRHNGRSGKHGTYDAKHNDRRFDVENSEHIDAERTKMNVYWDCYQGYSLQNDKDERARFTFTEIEKVDCQHFFRQIFLGYFPDIVQAFDTLGRNVYGDDYTSLHNPIVLSSVLLVCEIFHSTQILF